MNCGAAFHRSRTEAAGIRRVRRPFPDRLPPELPHRSTTGTYSGNPPAGWPAGSARPAIKRKRPRQNCMPGREPPGTGIPAGEANPCPDYVLERNENFIKRGRVSKNETRQPEAAKKKTGRTGTNVQQAGNQKYRAPVRQNTTRIRRETNEKMPRRLNLSEHFITLASVI